jgi:low temperature requirement protein LtrA
MIPMRARDPAEPHRAATPLELLFDLCFVVAIAQGARGLHHAVGAGHAAEGVVTYAMVFFAIWWAWMQYTWFASSYDTDGVVYRVLVMVQIVGALALAAGVPRAFEHRDFSVMTVAYVIMRVALVWLWILVARDDVERRATARRYIIAILVCQVGWLAILALPPAWLVGAWLPLVVLELMTPVWAERTGDTLWHPHHIIERYGLLTLIVLGESVASTTLAVQAALDHADGGGHRIVLIAGAPLIFFAMWWIYFGHASRRLHAADCASTAWAYGHYLLFASAAAVGAGLAVAAEHPAGPAVAVPVAVFLVAMWIINPRHRDPVLLVAAGLALAAGWAPWTELVLGAVLVGATVTLGARHPATGPHSH